MFAPKPIDDESLPGGKPPATPGYHLIHPPFGEGSYGKVWLARAVPVNGARSKFIYQFSFGENTDAPIIANLDGVTRYQRLSGMLSGSAARGLLS